jgi:hypothetical protein
MMVFLFGGCSTFRTTQEDSRTNEKTGETTTVKTSVSSTTFFDSRSALANFKATQTEKSQGAAVGSLNQESSATNTVNLIEGVVGAAVNAAVKSVVLKP